MLNCPSASCPALGTCSGLPGIGRGRWAGAEEANVMPLPLDPRARAQHGKRAFSPNFHFSLLLPSIVLPPVPSIRV